MHYLQEFTKDLAYEVLKQTIPSNESRGLLEYYDCKDDKNKKAKNVQKKENKHQKWIGAQMTTEYNKMLASGVVPSMEDVVVATATTIGEMGVGPNERDILQQVLGMKSGYVHAMATDMAAKGKANKKPSISQKGINNRLHHPVPHATPSPVIKKVPPVASLPSKSSNHSQYQGESDYTHSSDDSFGQYKKRKQHPQKSNPNSYAWIASQS